MSDVKRKAKFSLGKPPVIDPCINCLLSMVCKNGECVEKIKYEDNNLAVKLKLITITTNPKKIKNNNFWRKVNGIKS